MNVFFYFRLKIHMQEGQRILDQIEGFIESVSMANDKVFKSVPYASSQATTSSNRFANAGIPA